MNYIISSELFYWKNQLVVFFPFIPRFTGVSLLLRSVYWTSTNSSLACLYWFQLG